MPKHRDVKLTECYGIHEESDSLPFPSVAFDLQLAIGEDSWLYAQVVDTPEGTVCNILDLEAYPKRRGIGTLLMKSLVLELQNRGVKHLLSDRIESPALLLRKKLFGEEHLQYYDSEDKHGCILPMTTEQVLESLKRFNRVKKKYDELHGHIGCRINLELIDTSSWEV